MPLSSGEKTRPLRNPLRESEREAWAKCTKPATLGSTLMPTSRFSRASRARQTSPIPPRPSNSTISKLPSLPPALNALIVDRGRAFQEGIGLLIQQRLHLCAQVRIVRTGLRQERGALLRQSVQGSVAELHLLPAFSVQGGRGLLPASSSCLPIDGVDLAA